MKDGAGWMDGIMEGMKKYWWMVDGMNEQTNNQRKEGRKELINRLDRVYCPISVLVPIWDTHLQDIWFAGCDYTFQSPIQEVISGMEFTDTLGQRKAGWIDYWMDGWISDHLIIIYQNHSSIPQLFPRIFDALHQVFLWMKYFSVVFCNVFFACQLGEMDCRKG